MKIDKKDREKLSAAAKKVAPQIRRSKRYPFKIGVAFEDGKPCCAFGHVLDEAGYDLKEKGGFVLVNSSALELALGVWPVTGSLREACSSISRANDNDDHRPAALRRKVTAEALEYFADVIINSK